MQNLENKTKTELVGLVKNLNSISSNNFVYFQETSNSLRDTIARRDKTIHGLKNRLLERHKLFLRMDRAISDKNKKINELEERVKFLRTCRMALDTRLPYDLFDLTMQFMGQ